MKSRIRRAAPFVLVLGFLLWATHAILVNEERIGIWPRFIILWCLLACTYACGREMEQERLLKRIARVSTQGEHQR